MGHFDEMLATKAKAKNAAKAIQTTGKTVEEAVKPVRRSILEMREALSDGIDGLSDEIKTSNELRDRATQELLSSLMKKGLPVTVDISAIAKAIGKEIGKMPAPVINVLPREPISYKATIERNRKGEMSGATIDPILEAE